MTCPTVKINFSLFLKHVYLTGEQCDRMREEYRRYMKEWKNITQSNWATAYGDWQHNGILHRGFCYGHRLAAQINKPEAEQYCLYERCCTWIPANWTLKLTWWKTNFGKNVSGDRKLRWAQTLTTRWFHKPNVLAYGKYGTLQTQYISHVHRNQRVWINTRATDKYYRIYWLYWRKYIIGTSNTTWPTNKLTNSTAQSHFRDGSSSAS